MSENKSLNNTMKRLSHSQNLLAAILLLLVLAFFYRDVVLNGKTFLMEIVVPGTMPGAGPYRYKGISPGFVANDPGAIAWQIEPFNRFLATSLKKGDFPLWNPYAGLAGSPLLADGHTGPLEPLQFLFFFIPNRYWPYAVDLQLLIRFFLAGYFCYLFVQRLKINFLGSISAGVLFMLSSYFVTFGNHPQIKTEVLLPLVLYGYDRLVDFEDRPGLWLCALFIGWAIIAAMPESTFFILFLGTLWYFYKSIVHWMEAGKNFTKAKNIFLRYLAPTMLGLLISAAYLLPFLEFVSLAKSAHSEGFSYPLFPLWALPNLIFQVSGSFYLQLGFFAIFSLIFSLACLKDWSVEYRQNVIFFSLYAIISIFLIYDFPPTNWIHIMPVFNQLALIKYPVPSIVFCLAVLTGILIDRIIYTPLSYKKLSLSLLIIFILFIGLPTLKNPSKSLYVYFSDSNSAYATFGLIFSMSIILILLVFLYKRQKISARIMQVSLLFLVVLEPFFWSGKINRPDRVDPFQSPPFVDYLRGDKEPFRIFGLDRILYPNVSTAYRLADIRWLNALIPQRAFNFSTKFIQAIEPWTMRLTGDTLPVSDGMFDLLGVKYVLSANSSMNGLKTNITQLGQDSPLYKEVYRDRKVLIYQNKDVSPRAFVVYNIVDVSNPADAFTQLASSNIELKQTAVVENLPIKLVNLLNMNDKSMQAEAGNARLISSGELEVEVHTKAPGLLVVTDQYYPGWKAYTDGKLAPIYAVDGIFRGVFLEKGDHIVQFKYRPLSFIIGVIISSLSLLVAVVSAIYRSKGFPKKYE